MTKPQQENKRLRDQQINAEIADLQRSLRLQGYTLGEVVDIDAAPDEVVRTMARLWLLGYALHNEGYAAAAGF